MLHSRLLSTRFLLAAGAFLAVSSVGLGLPQRGAAQDDMTPRPAAPADSAGGAASGGGTETDSAPASTGDGSADDRNTGSAGNGGDSAAGTDGGTDGGTASNPSVGVDNTGSASAVGTRSGRTNRQRRRVTPSNPLVLTNPTRGRGPGAVGNGGEAGGNRIPPLIPPREPGVYTLQTDPFHPRLRPGIKPLPLFGYDFFQPARQIIIARRRALLPRPARVPSRTGAGTRSRSSRTQPGVNTGDRVGSGGLGADTNGLDTNGLETNGPDANGDVSGGDLNAAGRGAAGRRRSAAGDGTDTTGNYPTDPNAPDAGNGNGTGGNGQSYGSQSYGSQSYGNGDTSAAGGTDNTGQNSGDTGGDVNGQATGRRPGSRRTDRAGTDSSGAYSGAAFPGDAAAPGSDIQFPGDDALLTGGSGAGDATNAVGGELADPVATLLRPVVTSLPPNYQIQPGDLLTVRYSALTLAPREFNTTVDAQGGVAVEGVGRLAVAGRTAAQAETTLRSRLSRLYRNVDVSISLRQLRTIQVTVSGASFAPGTYTVPASATAFSLLTATGGPTANGSLRDIRVLRGGRQAGILDIYPLISAGTGSPSARHGDVNLQSGDNIYIPSPVSRVSVRGEVRQQAVYELTPTETLRDALGYAGGVKPSGVAQNVHIDTVNNGTGRIIVDVNLRDRAQVAKTPLYDGDSVEVSSVRAILTNRVTISGEVDQPGDYALTRGMRVTDLLQRAGGPLYDAYLDQAQLTRLNADNTTTLLTISIARALDSDAAQNVPLKRFDTLRLFSRQDEAFRGRRTVEVRGDVQRPGLYTQSDNMKVSDLLLDTGGPLPDAYLSRAVLLHQRGDGTFAYDYVNLRAILSGSADEDRPVLDNDVLAVYRIGEAHFTPDHTVKILGDVVAPGLYARGEGMQISDLVKLAGAYKPGGGTVVMLSHARQPNTTSPSLVSPPVVVAYNGSGVLTPSGDTVLQDGDVVTVQGNGSIKDHPPIVTVTGAVAHPGPFPIDSMTRLSDAIRKAGGLLPEAFPQGAEFTRTSETLVTTGQMTLAQTISQISDMLNQSQFQRERAKASLELIQLAGSAANGTSSGGLLLPGLTPGAGGAASNPNIAPLVGNLSQINPVSPGRLLTPSQLQPNGAVAVRLADALRRPGGGEDFLLKDGDTIVVPQTPTTVQVVGAVFAGRGVVFKPGQSVDYYIKYVGGFTPDAAKDRIEVIHTGGGLIPAGDAGAIQPGDLILVPTKVLAEKISRGGNSFSSLFQGLIGSALTLKILGVLK
jgi:protein involved in polysaccharide export with SLBB domain